jgi:hypothetical protein
MSLNINQSVISTLSVLTSPMLGGVLSRPAATWPDTFGKIIFFHEYPYFLPCGVAALIALTSFFIASVGLKEVSFPLA